MSFRSMLLGSVAVTGLLVGSQVADVHAAEASRWSGFYIGVGGGASVATPEINSLGVSAAELYADETISSSGSDSFLYGSATYDDLGLGSSGGFSMEHGSAAFLGKGYIGDLTPPSFGSGSFFGSGGIFGGGLGPFDLGSVFEAGKAGFLGRVETGADFESNGLLFGLNASYDFSKIEQNSSSTGVEGGSYDITSNAGIDAFGSVGGLSQLDQSIAFGNTMAIGARAGFLVGQNSLVFVSAGYARQKVGLRARYSGLFSTDASVDSASASGGGMYGVTSSTTEWMDGFYVGGGLEQLAGDNLSLKLEYRYTDLGKINTSDDIQAGVSGGSSTMYAGVASEADITSHAVVATINFRF